MFHEITVINTASPENNRVPAAIMARDLILDANEHYPASATAQGAFIARMCKEAGNNKPLKLAQAFFRNSQAVDYVIQKANLDHKRHDVFTTRPMDYTNVSWAVRQAFSLAHDMMVLDEQQLEEIIGSYRKYVGDAVWTNPLRRDENTYRTVALNFVQEAKKTRRKNRFGIVFRWMRADITSE